MVASSSVAVIGPDAHAATAERGAPIRVKMLITNHSDSGISAMAVTRWLHQCCVPDLAAPSPRARPSMERMMATNTLRYRDLLALALVSMLLITTVERISDRLRRKI